jgi:vacuolar iron transporter family protein
VDDYDYLPDGSWPPEDAPYARYAGRGRPAAGRHRAAGEQEYALSRVNGAPPRQPANGWRAPGNQPPNGRPGPGYLPDSRPRPPYPSNSGPMPAYRAPSGPMPAYRPSNGNGNGRPATPYPSNSGPMPAYRAPSGPMPAYRPPNGNGNGRYPSNSGPMPAYRPGTGPMQMTMPVPAELPMPTPIPSYRPPIGPAPANGRQVLGWLPFGNRLVLLPKGLGDDEELREHRDVNGGWLRPAVFGAMDGLVTNSSLIAGVGAGGGAHGAIVLTGIAGLIAGAFSMATGEYISVSSQNELTQSEVELERRQHARDPVGKRRRLAHLFMEKGVSPNLAEAVVHQISADPDRAVATHVREELGIDPDDLPSPRTAAIASLSSFVVGALIPLSPFLAGHPVLKAALVISGVAAFAGGAAVAKLTGRSMVLGGLRQLTAAALATGMALAIGHLIGGHVS